MTCDSVRSLQCNKKLRYPTKGTTFKGPGMTLVALVQQLSVIEG